MGVFNLTSYQRRRESIRILTEEQKKVTPPEVSNFEEDYNHLFVEDIDNQKGIFQIEENSQNNNIIHSSHHLITNKLHLTEGPLIVKILCKGQLNGMLKKVENIALLVTPYDLIYLKKEATCKEDAKALPFSPKIYYLKNGLVSNHEQIIRIYDNFLYGDVEKKCTKNWAWQRQKSKPLNFQTYLEPGSLLNLQLYNNDTRMREVYLATVKRVINSQLIELDQHIGASFKYSKAWNFSTINPHNNYTTVDICQILTKKPIELKTGIINNQYISKDILAINQSIFKVKQPLNALSLTNIFCICQSKKPRGGEIKLIDMQVYPIKKLWLNYYQVLIKSKSFIYPGLRQTTLSQCESIFCFPFLQKNSQKPLVSKERFYEITKLTLDHPTLTLDSDNHDKFYIIKISNYGILKLRTSKNGKIYTYYLSQTQIIKIHQYENGTKEVQKQNPFYQNSTEFSFDEHQNHIYVYVGKMSNGQRYGGIWKFYDHLVFPRFLLEEQLLLDFSLQQSRSEIRIIDTSKLRQQDSLAITKFTHLIQKHYQITKKDQQKLNDNIKSNLQRIVNVDNSAEKVDQHEIKQELKIQQPQSGFLDQAYSINYTYSNGQFCGPPINKNRKTTVTIRCGTSWFEIVSLFEMSPCQYLVVIETAYLCERGYKDLVDSDTQLFNKDENDIIPAEGILCYPRDQLYNEATMYVYMGKKLYANQ